MINCQPLVTIIVITYNSDKYVLETLESIKRQSYKFIELLIADDGSVDRTVTICNDWINDNSDYFVHLELITTNINTGTSDNCNRALKRANGEWLKVIAGDDILDDNAILNYVDYVHNHPKVNALFGQSVHFYEKYTDKAIPVILDLNNVFFGDNVTANRQFNILTKFFVGSGPAFFVKTELVKQIGGYDSRFPLQEDYPLFIKLTKCGHKLYVFDKLTVYKRMHDESVINTRDYNSIFSKLEILCYSTWREQYKHENMNVFWRILHNYSLLLKNAIIKKGNSKSILLCRYLYCLLLITDPILWYARVLNIIEKTIRIIER